jgi:hypothetical protein
MARTAPAIAIVKAAALICGLAVFAAPVEAESAARARLVHCGADTCLRLSGHRPDATTAVSVGGWELAVDGGRDWQATVPLATARTWPIARGYALRVTIADAAGMERVQSVPLPPGALGSHVELASLVVSGR